MSATMVLLSIATVVVNTCAFLWFYFPPRKELKNGEDRKLGERGNDAHPSPSSPKSGQPTADGPARGDIDGGAGEECEQDDEQTGEQRTRLILPDSGSAEITGEKHHRDDRGDQRACVGAESHGVQLIGGAS